MIRLGSRARELDWGPAQIFCQAHRTTVYPNLVKYPALSLYLSNTLI